jgi:hypothetical protein
MQFLLSSQQTKPNRVETAEQDKDITYHIQYARWVVGSGSNHLHMDYLRRYEINRNFYMNRQWVMEEDLEAFFKDENNNDRNRLQVTRNYIQPMVEQYRGNADRMTFDMKVANLSPLAKSRRERSLNKLKAYNFVGKKLPGFQDYIQANNFPTGEDDVEVESKFNNLYADSLVVDANKLLRYFKNLNKIDSLKMPFAIDVALGGICIAQSYPYAGEWITERIPPDQFGWDRTAKQPDLTDSSYFFKYKDAEVSTVFERYQNISPDLRKSIENFASRITGSSFATNNIFTTAGKIPVYTAFWKDMTIDYFGYVTDEYGQRILHRINYVEQNEVKPQYTEKDLVPYNNLTEYQKRVLKGNNIAQLYVDLWRYCDFVPKEILGVVQVPTTKDVALEWGVVSYQEPDLYKPTNMSPLFKVGTWSYLDGVTLSPVDVVINPQRMINRFLSVMENQINNSGGAGVVFDKDLLGSTSEDEVRSMINKGEAIGINAKGRGVQNVMGRYDSTPKESVVAFSNLIESFKMAIEEVTGVNQAVKGDTGNPDQLVGVMQLMIQRGSLIQEPFYSALTDCFRGCYQSAISSGRRYYADNMVELVDAVGEDAAEIIKLSKDTNTESLRLTLTRSIDSANERLAVDATIMSYIQFALLDQETASSLLGRASMEELLFSMREYQKRLANQKRMAAQAAQVQGQTAQNVQDQAGQIIYNQDVAKQTQDQLNKNADRVAKLRIAGMGKK